jgi:hypothetical protein
VARPPGSEDGMGVARIRLVVASGGGARDGAGGHGEGHDGVGGCNTLM